MRLLAIPFLALIASLGTAAVPPPPDPYALSAEEFFKWPVAQTRITKDAADITLLEAAVFHQSNRERIAAKLPPFKPSTALHAAARGHSDEMAKLQYFDHTSPTSANRTMADRLRTVGLANVAAGENIAVQPAREMGSGEYLIRKNPDGTETWTDRATGKIMSYYTYEQLAKEILTNWMNSPHHRENLMNKEYLYLGIGAARGPYGTNKQDSFYFTQNFASSVPAGK